MDWLLFLKIICWAGFGASMLVLLLGCFVVVYERCTVAGQLSVLCERMRGRESNYLPTFLTYGFWAIIFGAALISMA